MRKRGPFLMSSSNSLNLGMGTEVRPGEIMYKVRSSGRKAG